MLSLLHLVQTLYQQHWRLEKLFSLWICPLALSIHDQKTMMCSGAEASTAQVWHDSEVPPCLGLAWTWWFWWPPVPELQGREKHWIYSASLCQLWFGKSSKPFLIYVTQTEDFYSLLSPSVWSYSITWILLSTFPSATSFQGGKQESRPVFNGVRCNMDLYSGIAMLYVLFSFLIIPYT